MLRRAALSITTLSLMRVVRTRPRRHRENDWTDAQILAHRLGNRATIKAQVDDK